MPWTSKHSIVFFIVMVTMVLFHVLANSYYSNIGNGMNLVKIALLETFPLLRYSLIGENVNADSAEDDSKAYSVAYPIVERPIMKDLPVGNKTPNILIWVSFTGAEALPGSFYSDAANFNCTTLLPLFKSDRCFFTNDRNHLGKADIVYFSIHEWRATMQFDPITTSRPSSQYWIFFEVEAPSHLYYWDWKQSAKKAKKLYDWRNVFNWTMTYRLDSTIPAPYARFVPREKPDFSRDYDRFQTKNTSRILFMASYCGNRMSHRDEYVRALAESGLEIEIIGSCDIPKTTKSPLSLDRDCPRNHKWMSSDECYRKIGQRYKFYLSFENSLCKDYVTEKFFRAAAFSEMIPVVLNGANMSRIAPPHSYIDTKDFKSPHDLAAFLNKTSSDATLYNSYFKWKPYYDVIQVFDGTNYRYHMCQLCAYAQQYLTDPKPARIDDIEDWWVNGGNCTEGPTAWP